MATKVTVSGVKELAAASAALRLVDRNAKTQVGRAVRSAVPTIWSPRTVLAHARTKMDRAALAGTSVRTSSTRLTLAAGTAPTIGRGADLARAVEFGDPSKTVAAYTRRSRKGGTHQVRRRTQQQLPAPVRRGRVVHPAFAQAMPRIVSLYVQTVVRTIHEAWEGKRG